ncbi:hypothetical protein FRC03_006327 [Tulasnella sp. 419]|nr:hypothetical protein FRC03_006327 [Tulasnella sp. 419]
MFSLFYKITGKAESELRKNDSTGVVETPKVQPSHFSSLPNEIVEEILTYYILDHDLFFEAFREKIRTLSSVNRQFLAHARRLRILSLSIRMMGDSPSDEMSRQGWKDLQDREQNIGSQRAAACQSLRIRVFGPTMPYRSPESKIQTMLRIVNPTLKYLEISEWGCPDALLGIPKDQRVNYSFPRLVEVKLLGSFIASAHSVVVKLRELMSVPLLELHVHHVFEPHMERHLLSLSPDMISNSTHGNGRPVFLEESEKSRRLDVYIDRRSDVGPFVDLVLRNGIERQEDYIFPKKGDTTTARGVHSLNIWLKDAEDMPKELDNIIRREKWRKYIKWDVLPYSASQLAEAEDWCKAKRCQKAYVCRCKSTVED